MRRLRPRRGTVVVEREVGLGVPEVRGDVDYHRIVRGGGDVVFAGRRRRDFSP